MRNPIAALAAIGASLVVSQAFASDDALEQIVVTGARTPIAATDVGSAVTVITREDIDRRQVRFVTDLLRAVPGFAVSHAGVVGSQTQVRVRGSEANHVLVLVDGVRANDPATGDEFRWEFLSTANIERIEIVSGPQSALWGSDAIGGVVHIITRSGNAGNNANAYVEVGSESTLNAAAGGNLGGENWSAGLGIERLATDGFNIARSGEERDDADITTATLNVRFSPSDTLELTLGARAVDAYTQFDAVDFFVTGLPTDSNVATDTSQTYAYIGAMLGAADARVRHRLSVRYFDSDNQNFVEQAYDSSTSSDRRTLAYQADIAVRAARLSLAVEHEQTRFAQQGAFVFDDPNQEQETEVTSAITDVHGRAGETLSWLFSLRFDDHSDFEDILTGRVSPACGPVSARDRKRRPSSSVLGSSHRALSATTSCSPSTLRLMKLASITRSKRCDCSSACLTRTSTTRSMVSIAQIPSRRPAPPSIWINRARGAARKSGPNGRSTIGGLSERLTRTRTPRTRIAPRSCAGPATPAASKWTTNSPAVEDSLRWRRTTAERARMSSSLRGRIRRRS